MRRVARFLFVFASVAWIGGSAMAETVEVREMAVTLDDLPQNSRMRDPEHHRAVNARLLAALRAEEVPAVGFVNASKCYDETGAPRAFQRELLVDWLEAGFELGNHTWSHPDYCRLDLAAYLDDVDRGAVVLRELISEHDGPPLRWFRHPYLHRGDTPEKRVGLEKALADRGYREAAVTIDNGEWVYAAAYDYALLRGDDEEATRIGDDYVRYMLDMVEFWEGQSQALLGRNMRHVLLLHANTINADRLPELLAGIRERGYRFVTLERALDDAAYDEQVDTFTGHNGISWLHRWGLTREVDRAIYAGEPRVPEWVETASRPQR